MIDQARGDLGVAAACLLAFRDHEETDAADVGAVLIAETCGAITAIARALLKK